MAVRQSAGILLFRRSDAGVEVLLGHMGGPFWERKDAGAWSVPKGEYEPDEQPLAAARREFTEELGLPAPNGEPLDLGSVRQSGGPWRATSTRTRSYRERSSWSGRRGPVGFAAFRRSTGPPGGPWSRPGRSW